MGGYLKSRSGARALSIKQATSILKMYGIFGAKISFDEGFEPFYRDAKHNFIWYELDGVQYSLLDGKITNETEAWEKYLYSEESA